MYSQEKFDEDKGVSEDKEESSAETKAEPKIKSDSDSKTEKKQSAQKNELKTLIASDWGDEDEEAF